MSKLFMLVIWKIFEIILNQKWKKILESIKKTARIEYVTCGAVLPSNTIRNGKRPLFTASGTLSFIFQSYYSGWFFTDICSC